MFLEVSNFLPCLSAFDRNVSLVEVTMAVLAMMAT